MDNKNYSDEELVSGCLADDRKCQEALYRKFADGMYNVCHSYTKDQDEACDILQEGFIKIFRKIDTYKSDGSLGGWIRKIMVNTALEFYRKNKRVQEAKDDYEIFVETKVEGIIEKINESEIIHMVNELPSKAGMVLKLYCIEGYNHQEIAGLMEISEGTSKSQLNRARSLLKEAIAKR